MTDSQTFAATTSPQPEKQSPLVSKSGFLLFLEMSQALCLAVLIFCAIATYLVLD